jgi:hypothetical protein
MIFASLLHLRGSCQPLVLVYEVELEPYRGKNSPVVCGKIPQGLGVELHVHRQKAGEGKFNVRNIFFG